MNEAERIEKYSERMGWALPCISLPPSSCGHDLFILLDFFSDPAALLVHKLPFNPNLFSIYISSSRVL